MRRVTIRRLARRPETPRLHPLAGQPADYSFVASRHLAAPKAEETVTSVIGEYVNQALRDRQLAKLQQRLRRTAAPPPAAILNRPVAAPRPVSAPSVRRPTAASIAHAVARPAATEAGDGEVTDKASEDVLRRLRAHARRLEDARAGLRTDLERKYYGSAGRWDKRSARDLAES
jgi:hypothetical protein